MGHRYRKSRSVHSTYPWAKSLKIIGVLFEEAVSAKFLLLPHWSPPARSNHQKQT